MKSKIMKLISYWTLKKHVVVSIIFIVVIILFRTQFDNEAASIAIIGGVDGPTAFYLSGHFLPLKWALGYGLLFICLMALYIFVKKLKKSKSH
jgi:Na+-transporting methylmalonyl-CoA/oxaloacetate decarboxylase beta subunit